MPCAHDADRRLREALHRELRNVAFNAWFDSITNCAKNLLFPPLCRRRDVHYPAHVHARWFFSLDGVGREVYKTVRAAAFGMAKRMYYVHKLHQRPDAGRWRRWLMVLADSFSARYIRGTLEDVAFRMAEMLAERYNISFSYHLLRRWVVFVARNPEYFGDGWEVLRDEVVWGNSEQDVGYLREVFAYHSEKRLLLCLHHREVPYPSERHKPEWVLFAEWWDIDRGEAQALAAGA